MRETLSVRKSSSKVRFRNKAEKCLFYVLDLFCPEALSPCMCPELSSLGSRLMTCFSFSAVHISSLETSTYLVLNKYVLNELVQRLKVLNTS